MNFDLIPTTSVKGSALHALAAKLNYLLNLAVLSVDGACTNLDLVTINGIAYELRSTATDTTINTSGNEWNNTNAGPLTVTMAAHGLTAGTILRVGTEFFVVDSVVSVNSVVVSRAKYGSTNAVHADGVDIFKQVTAGTAGRLAIPCSAIGTAATVASELATAVNFHSSEDMVVASSGIKVYFTSPKTLTLTEGGANLSAVVQAGVAKGAGNSMMVSKLATAGDVSAGLIYFALPFVPTATAVDVITRQTGVRKAFDGAATIVGRLVIVDNAGSVDWAANDVVRLYALG